jgi:hypothetical protein
VRDPDGDMPALISLQLPGPPANVRCGVMSGVAYIAHEPLPVCLADRFHPRAGYAEPRSHQSLFRAYGRHHRRRPGGARLNVPEADRLDAFTRKFIGKRPTQVTPQDQVTFASMLEPRAYRSDWLRGSLLRHVVG